MPSNSTGFSRDINLLRRRAWLFIPFFVLGIILAIAFRSVAGNANSVATMQLETLVQEIFNGGDRGFRIFEAQAMASDPAFKEKVKAEIGDKEFDYARFSISLAPISVADGISRGTLTVSIQDPVKGNADKYRDAFVKVFTQEYTASDGLFRTRFVAKRTAVANDFELKYQEAFKRLKDIAAAKNITLPLDEIQKNGSIYDALTKQESELVRTGAEVNGAIAAIQKDGTSPTAAASVAASILGQPVAPGDALPALTTRASSIKAAIDEVRKLRTSTTDGAQDPEFLKSIDDARVTESDKIGAYSRLSNARGAVSSAESTIETSLSGSGGVAGSNLGRIAVVIAVTLVFGLIAIFAVEWLSQIRAGIKDE